VSDPETYPHVTQRRFWAKVDVRGPDDCWLWTGSTLKSGYGMLTVRRKGLLAHRVSWELHHGPIPVGEGYHGICVLHDCDVRNCVNPGHLFLGTHLDNMDDMRAKGRNRQPRGESTAQAKLTEPKVLEIRRLYASGGYTQTELGDDFGVTQAAISAIVTRKNWPWLREE
jgi:hypothetical protein